MNHNLSHIHRWLPNARNARHTLLLLHGTGGDENDLLPLGSALDNKASLLSVRGNVLEHGMPRFFRRLAEGVFDQEDLLLQTNALAAFLMEAWNSYGSEMDCLVGVGFSNGANIAASLLLRYPRSLKGAILLRPMFPFTPERMPNLSGIPILILSGTQDTIVPFAQSEALAKLLQQAGADVTLNRLEAGHSLTPQDIKEAQSWLARRYPHFQKAKAEKENGKDV